MAITLEESFSLVLNPLIDWIRKNKSKGYVNYINENGKLKTLPLNLVSRGGGQYYYYCQFKEPAFVVSYWYLYGTKNHLVDVNSKGGFNTNALNPKELHFMTCGYFNRDFLTNDDFRKPESFFSIRDEIFSTTPS